MPEQHYCSFELLLLKIPSLVRIGLHQECTKENPTVPLWKPQKDWKNSILSTSTTAQQTGTLR